MEKGFGLGSVTLITCASILGLVAIACEESDTSTFPGETVDASTDSPGGFGSSSGGSSGATSSSGEGGTPGAKCEPVILDGYKANWTAPAAPASPGPCTGTTVGTYYDECLATLGNADHQARCDAWKTANAACGECIEPTNNGGPIQWHQNRFYYTLNVAGCIGINQNNDFGETKCAYAYGSAINCARDACAGCFETVGATFDNFRNCQNAAKMVGLCKSLDTNVGSTCGGVQTATETKGCFNENNAEQPRVHYTRVMGYFCATP